MTCVVNLKLGTVFLLIPKEVGGKTEIFENYRKREVKIVLHCI